jgi:stage V sporulation protein SpoVS
LLPEIVNIGAEKVKTVTITHADGETIVVGKSDREQTDFDVSGLPEGRELSYATVGNDIAGALAGLELQDVRASINGAVAATAVYQTWDGLKITTQIIAEDEDAWVTFAAESTVEESGASDAATEIRARVSGWQYRLPDYKKNLLTRRWDDILKSTDVDD